MLRKFKIILIIVERVQFLPNVKKFEKAPKNYKCIIDMESLIQTLHQTKMKEQADIAVITDTLEREFQTVVQPVMNSCTKESMAVSFGVCGFCVKLLLFF